MRWTPGGRSADIEDRRGSSRVLGSGGLKLGLGGFIIVGVLSLVFKRNLFSDLSQVQSNQPASGDGQGQTYQSSPEEERRVQFVSFVLDDVQGTWQKQLAARGQNYPKAKLVLFSNEVRSACGLAGSATGPFYCPGDQKAYIDLSFYNELKSRFGASGDFAQAYVLAHEIGHHVQNVIGIERQVRQKQHAVPDLAGPLSVKMELQADCLAGIWGHSTEQRQLLDPGDLEQALNCASAIGDDRLQKQAGGRVNPETFTHGSSEQRMHWFKRGFDSGRLEDCDTFAAK